MAQVIFWEKPGCQGNRRQKEILLASGHQLEVRDLLTEAWDSTTLAKFFGPRPVREWFNPSNPRIKSGELDPATVPAADALRMMVEEPLLIVRPLMQVGDQRLAVENVDMLDGTPLLDIKPYVPAFDQPAEPVRSGWLERSGERAKEFLPQEIAWLKELAG